MTSSFSFWWISHLVCMNFHLLNFAGFLFALSNFKFNQFWNALALKVLFPGVCSAGLPSSGWPKSSQGWENSPITSSLPSRSLAWALTPTTDRVLLRKEVVIANSASCVLTCPLLPFWGPATLTLEMARWWIREWRSSDPSPNAPTTTPFTSPSEPSLVSTGPVLPGAVPQFLMELRLALFALHLCSGLDHIGVYEH